MGSAIVAACLLLVGCAARPAGRAQEKAAEFGRLAPADQRLVLGGQVRKGLHKEAVYIAWGTPTSVRQPGPEQGPCEAWLYTRTFYGQGNGYFGSRRGLVWSPRDGRYYYNADDYYQPPVYIRSYGQVDTEVPYRSAVFDGETLVSFEARPAPHDEGER